MNAGLLRKDFKQLKSYWYLIFFLLSILLEPDYLSIVSMFYVTMVAFTLSENDEKDGFDFLIRALPYRSSEIVRSRYFISYLMIIAVSLWTLLIPSMYSLVSGQNVDFLDTLVPALRSFCIGSLANSFIMPIVYRCGANKAKMRLLIYSFLLIIVLSGLNILGLSAMLLDRVSSVFIRQEILWSIFVLIAILVAWISLFASINMHERST